MAILGIDFGKKKVGLSISDGFLASPYQTLRFKNQQELLKKISLIIKEEKVDLIVVGLPDPDRIGAGVFGQKLSKFLKVKTVFIDETLTTFEAQRIQTKRNEEKEHQIAASLILKTYLENKND